jgi:CNT family concentrative nucleoside transporter
MEKFIGILGLALMLVIAWLFSPDKKAIPKRVVIWGLILQVSLGILVLGIPALGFSGPLGFLFAWGNTAVTTLLDFTLEGSRFMFGNLMDTKSYGYIFALQVLPTIVFFSAFISVLYHVGVMQIIIKAIASIMYRTMKTSGAETLSSAANIFVGQTEAPLVIKPFIKKMTQSELLTIMIGGMATVAGGVMAAYVGFLKDRIPDIAGHLITASVMSAPAALVIAKLMLPEKEKPETQSTLPDGAIKKEVNIIGAAANGISTGLHMALNVGAMLLAFVALIALVNFVFGWVGSVIGFETWGQGLVPEIVQKGETTPLSLNLILGWLFAPLAFFMGVPWDECIAVGSLLGEKIVLNEFIAYLHLSEVLDKLSDRSVIIASYALCGFANFSSIGIQIGGIGEIAPERKADLAKLGIRSIIGGSLAAFMTATIAGLLL